MPWKTGRGKSLLDTSVWVAILLAKYFNQLSVERLLNSSKLLGLDLAVSTVNAGLNRLQSLFLPNYHALHEPKANLEVRFAGGGAAKSAEARHRRRESNLELRQRTLPFQAGDTVAND